jgi:hypothetical protein
LQFQQQQAKADAKANAAAIASADAVSHHWWTDAVADPARLWLVRSMLLGLEVCFVAVAIVIIVIL